MTQRKTYSAAENSGSSTSVYSPSSISILLPPSSAPSTINTTTTSGVSGRLTTSLVDEESYYSNSLCPFLISAVVPSPLVTTSFTAPTEGLVIASLPVPAMPTIHVPAPPVMSATAHPPLPPINSASLVVPASPIIWVSNPVPASKYPQPSHRASKAWKYYNVPENTTRMASTQVCCQLCQKIIPRGPGAGTTSMYRHLFRHHWHGSPSVSSEFRRQHSGMRQSMYPNLQDTGDEVIAASRLALVSTNVTAPGKRRRSHRTSEAWKYYDMADTTSQVPSTQVRCRLCDKIVLRGPTGGCTSSMYSHLFRHHWHGSPSVSSDFFRKHSAMRQRMCPNLQDTGDEEISTSNVALVSKPIPALKKRRRSHRTSEAWKYYDMADTSQMSSTQVRCRLCHIIVLRGPTGCTSSMYSHLFRHHWHGSPSVSSDFRRKHSAMRQRVCPNLRDNGDEGISSSKLALDSSSSGDAGLGGEHEYDRDAAGMHLVDPNAIM